MKLLIFLIFWLSCLPTLPAGAWASSTLPGADNNGSAPRFGFTLDIFGNADMNWIIDRADLEYAKAVINGTAPETLYADADGNGSVGPEDLDCIQDLLDKKAQSMTVVDSSGERVKIFLPVSRVVTLAPWGTRTLVQLGAQKKVVGIDMYTAKGSKYAEQLAFLQACPRLSTLTSIGTSAAPNKEVLASLQPDMILAGQITPGEVQVLKTTSTCPSVFQPNANLKGEDYAIENGPYENWLTLGYILDKCDRAHEIINFFENEFRQIQTRIETLPEAEKRTAWFCSGKVNRGSPVFSPIVLAGGTSLTADGKPTFGEIQIEQVIKWNPDVIFVQYWPHLSGMIDEIKTNKTLSLLKAVKTDQTVFLRNGRLGTDPAFSAAETWYIAKVLYPKRFADINVELRANKVLEFLYKTDGLYTWEITKRPVFKTWDHHD